MFFVLCPLRIIYSYIPDLELVPFSFEVDPQLSWLVVRVLAVTPLDFLAIHCIELQLQDGCRGIDKY